MSRRIYNKIANVKKYEIDGLVSILCIKIRSPMYLGTYQLVYHPQPIPRKTPPAKQWSKSAYWAIQKYLRNPNNLYLLYSCLLSFPFQPRGRCNAMVSEAAGWWWTGGPGRITVHFPTAGNVRYVGGWRLAGLGHGTPEAVSQPSSLDISEAGGATLRFIGSWRGGDSVTIWNVALSRVCVFGPMFAVL